MLGDLFLIKKLIYNVFNTCNTWRALGVRVLKVTVDYLGSIKQTLGLKQAEKVELEENASVSDLLSLLAEKYGDPFKKAVYEPKGLDLKPHHILSINGLLLNQLNGIETKLKDGDHIILMPVVTGG
jgi:molybdopterin synthase sulfur carrier subunit